MQPPSDLIQKAFLAPTVDVSRRVEIYESDGTTPWRQDLWQELLVGGSVSVDMGRDERRGVDLELENRSGALSPRAGGFWYDKVIKVFYGLRLGDDTSGGPTIYLTYPVDEMSSRQALELRSMLNREGLLNVEVRPFSHSLWGLDDRDVDPVVIQGMVSGADLCICLMGTNATIYQVPVFLGLNIPAIMLGGTENPGVYFDGVTSGPRVESGKELERLPDHTLPLAGAFDSWVLSPAEYTPMLSATNGEWTTFTPMLTATDESGVESIGGLVIKLSGIESPIAYINQSAFDEGAFVHGRDAFSTFIASLARGIALPHHEPEWEAQIGEFTADSIQDADDRSERVSLVGRDYAKRCLESRLAKSTMFGKDEPIERVIRNLAVNSGIIKIDLPVTGETLGKDMTWERDVERFSIMKEIALAKNFELFFNAEGVLVMRPQRDPLLTPATLDLTTGPGGNLISRGAKTSGGQLFNYVTVVGESSDTTTPLVYAEAVNDDPSSPTWIGLPGTPGGIGERTKNISSPLVTTSEQAQALADTMLSVSMLEEFELTFSSILLPWVEVGEILEMVDPESRYWGPSRYLLSSLSLPLDLGPMSGTGKRVTVVQ